MALTINKSYKLIRLGSENDGGYLTCPKSVIDSKNLISIGIDTNWEFEKDFLRKNIAAKIICYDGQINFMYILKFFVLQFLKTIVLKNSYSIFKRSFKNLFEYNYLLKRKLNFVNKNVGLKNGIDFKDIIRNKEKIFLKIDIEGSEYRILEDILKVQNKIEGLVIEFHDYDLHKQIITDFISLFSLKLIYISINEVGKFNFFWSKQSFK